MVKSDALLENKGNVKDKDKILYSLTVSTEKLQ